MLNQAYVEFAPGFKIIMMVTGDLEQKQDYQLDRERRNRSCAKQIHTILILGLHPSSDDLQLKSSGLKPNSDGLHPTSDVGEPRICSYRISESSARSP